MRPERLVLIAGTGTDVGKTWVGGRVLADLGARGVRVAARKPAQSFAPEEVGRTDADVLAAATGETPEVVCPPSRWYRVPMAPPMAAERLGLPRVAIAELVDELTWPDDCMVGLVETAGGVRSPLAHDGDTVDLAVTLGPDLVVLVADAGLGTLNAVRLSLDALSEVGAPCVVVLNRYDADDELHERNREWLATRWGIDVLDVETLVDRIETC